MRLQEGLDQLLQHVYACVQLTRFADEHEDMKQGEIFLFVEKRNLSYIIHHPNLIGGQ